MPLVSDNSVREALKGYIEDAFGPDCRVLTRMKLAFQADDWKAMVRSLTNDKTVNGWVFARTSIETEAVGIPTYRWDYRWNYTLWYFRTIEEKTSEAEINAKLDSLIAALENEPQLGLTEEDGFYGHFGLQVKNIDTINDQFHYVVAELTAYVTRQL